MYDINIVNVVFHSIFMNEKKLEKNLSFNSIKFPNLTIQNETIDIRIFKV